MDFQSLGPLLQYLAELVAEDVLAGPRLDITGATTRMDEMPLTAAIYARYSTDKQRET